MWKQVILASSVIVIAVTGCLLSLEIAFRFLPVFEGVYLQTVDENHPVARMEANRSLTYSVGWSMARATQNRVNNDGFVNNSEYQLNNRGNTTAVIGDSYVEALMLPHSKTVQAYLDNAIINRGDVFSFGISGAPMSQYLIWAQHARQRYKVDALIFIIVATDFDESLLKYRTRTGFHYFTGDLAQCNLQLTRLNHRPNPLRPVLQHSALLQYLVFNLGLLEGERRQAWLRSITTKDAIGAETDRRGIKTVTLDQRNLNLPKTRRTDSYCAIRTFFRLLPIMAQLKPERILFVIDGLRAYTKEARILAKQGYFSQMRSYFLQEAAVNGYQVIDADSLFKEHNLADNSNFEMPYDVHWNAKAHELVATQIMESALFQDLYFAP